MIFRKGREEDIPAIIDVMEEGRAFLKSRGVVQWQDGFPHAGMIKNDVKNGVSYVIEEDGAILAMAAIIFEADPCYAEIDGAWLNDEPYGVLHRVAVSDKARGKGLGDMMFENAEKLALEKGFKNLRIDTHRDNKVMQKLIARKGFTYCGVVVMENGDDRLRNGYQKIL